MADATMPGMKKRIHPKKAQCIKEGCEWSHSYFLGYTHRFKNAKTQGQTQLSEGFFESTLAGWEGGRN